jgi:ATP-binding cassette, subfamily F, member 3
MITLRQLSLSRGAKPLLERVDLTLHARQRVGIVGANGAGKSSLFALLRGELHQDAGDLDMPPRLTIASVAQETPALARAAIEYVLDGDERLRAAERAISEAESSGDGDALAHAHADFEEVRGYAARARAAEVMHGLGFTDTVLEKSVAAFSGGWRVRLNLARALACASDLLLLDEPTNHLDLDAVLWLEDWLRSYDGTLLMISHDRDFLDNVADNIWHFEERAIKRYSGNYSAFEQQRSAQLAQRQAMFEKQQREIAHMRSYIDRFRAKATKARAAQSRLKALARMELIAAAHVDSPFEFHFRAPGATSRSLVKLDHIDVGYGGTPVLAGVTLEIESGMRLALLGPNGAGKSTLIKLLAGLIAPARGERHDGKHLNIGYFAQHQLEQLREDESALKHCQRLDSAAREQDLRDFLGGFNFRGDMAEAPVGPFSGGEKARLALAMIIWRRPNLLLLDEPTNHLDLDMRHALSVALQEYEGALVVVSHDRHLLRTTTDRFLLVAHGKAQWFDGDLDDYRLRLKQARAEQEGDSTQSQPAQSRRDERRREAQERQRLSQLRKPLEKAIQQLEARMVELQREKATLETALADQNLYTEQRKEELKSLLVRQSNVGTNLALVEEQWLEAHAKLDGVNG